MENKEIYTREFIYTTLLSRLTRAAHKSAEAEPDNEYYTQAVEALEILSEGFERNTKKRLSATK